MTQVPQKYVPYICSALACAIMCIIYLPITQIDLSYFHNDDKLLINKLLNIDGIKDAFSFIFNTDHYKFRPVAYLQYLLEFILFGNNYSLYIAYNILLIATLNFIFILTLNIEKKAPLFLNLAITLCITLSKFLTYSAWNITGSFETLATIFFLSVLYFLFKNSSKGVFIFSVLLLLTSERFLPFVMITPILFSYISNPQATSLIMTGLRKFYLPLMIAGIYVLIRYLLGLPIIVGTQTDSVASSFNVDMFTLHIAKSFSEILGFSFGPAYLTGFQYADWVPFNALLLNIPFISVFFAFSILFIFSLYAYLIAILSFKKHITTLNIVMIALIFAASVTFRLELRWLLPAYLCFFMLIFRNFSFNLSKGDSGQFKRVKIFLCVTMILCTISASFLYHMHARSHLYFASKLDNSTALIIHMKPYFFKQPTSN